MSHRRVLHVWITLLFLAVCAQSAQADPLQFDSTEEAVQYAQRELGKLGPRYVGAIVMLFNYEDENYGSAAYHVKIRGGTLGTQMLGPGKAGVFFVSKGGEEVTLIFECTGYHELSRTVEVSGGKVLVVDDLVMERPTEADQSTIIGRVWLEDSDEIEGITVRIGDDAITTDEKGRFRFDKLPSGKKYVSAYKPGYIFSGGTVQIERGTNEVVALKGYLIRSAQVQWAYQPLESRDLSDGLVWGEAVLDTREMDNIVFAGESEERKHRPDVGVYQKGTELILRCSHIGSDGPGFIQLEDIGLDEILQAPKAEYKHPRTPLKEGDAFICKTYDGKHFAKLQVLAINVGTTAKRRSLADIARQPLE